MDQAVVIKSVKKKGLRVIELLSHGFIRIDGAMLTYNRWKVAFDQITIPKNISIKKKKEYLAEMTKLRKYYLEWLSDPVAAEAADAKKAAAAKKVEDAKKAAAAKKVEDAKKVGEAAPKGVSVDLETLKKAEAATPPPIQDKGPDAIKS